MLTDGVDYTSALNLLRLLDTGHGYYALSKQVSRAAFGGLVGEMTYVAITAVPMGYSWAVDVIQNFMRLFMFEVCGVPPVVELRRDMALPDPEVAVVCMDGADIVSKAKIGVGAMQVQGTNQMAGDQSRILARFVAEYAKQKLPVKQGKSVEMSLDGMIFGGELDGVLGTLMHGRKNGKRLVNRSLGLLAMKRVPQVTPQHWAGLFCFMKSFRRPMFSIGQDMLPAISAYEDRRKPCYR